MRPFMVPSIAVAMIIAACGENVVAGNDLLSNAGGAPGYGFTPDARRQYPPVTARNAPNIAELKARGLEQTGWDADMYACGPACDAVYAYAVFFGRRAGQTRASEHLFTCPNTGTFGVIDQWRCAPYTGTIGAR